MSKYIINIDKLILNLEVGKASILREVIMGGNTSTEEISLIGEFNYIAKHNRNTVKVYLLGKHIGTVRHKGQSFIHNSSVQFHFNKPMLYNGQWYTAFSRLMKELKLEYKGIHSMEIAYDSAGLLRQLFEWYTNSTLVGQNRYKPYGRRNFTPFSISSDRIDSFYMGGKLYKSDREAVSNSVEVGVKVYDKLKDARAKDELYFLDYYQKNGFSLDEGIDRCELTIKGWKINGGITDLEMLTDTAVLVSILKDYARNYLKWHDLSDYKWQNRNKVYKVVELIDFENLESSNIKFKQLSSGNNYKLKPYKSLLKMLYSDYICKGDTILRDALLYYILEDEILKEWTLLRYKYFKVDFERPCEDGVEERIKEMDLVFTLIQNGFDPFEE